MGWILIILMGVLMVAQAAEVICAIWSQGKRAAVVYLLAIAVGICVIWSFRPQRGGAAEDVFGPAGGMSAAEQKELVAWE